jgi:CRP-like cAMP-binding protein
MTPTGDEIAIALLGPGEHFGEMALVGPEAQRSATVDALEASETFAVHRTDFAELRERHRSIDQILIASLAHEIRTLHGRLLEALYLPAERRVLRRLVELAAVYRSGSETEVVLPLTQQELANFAGAARATVNHVLREEQHRGTIELQRGKTIIRDLEALRKRAR